MEGIVLVDGSGCCGRLDEIARLAFNRCQQRGHRTITIVKLVSEEMYSRLDQLRSVGSPRERKWSGVSDRSSSLLMEVPAANLMFFGDGCETTESSEVLPTTASSQQPSSQSRQSPRVKMFHSEMPHLSTQSTEQARLGPEYSVLQPSLPRCKSSRHQLSLCRIDRVCIALPCTCRICHGKSARYINYILLTVASKVNIM